MKNRKAQFYTILLIFFLIIITDTLILYSNTNNLKENSKITDNKSEDFDSLNLINFPILVAGSGNRSKLHLKSISDPGGPLIPEKPGLNYISFIGSNLSLHCNLIDRDYKNTLILDENHQAIFSISYNKTTDLGEEGVLSNSIRFDNETKSYKGIIDTAVLTELGNYSIEINVDLLDYNFIPFKFNLTIRDLYDILLSINPIKDLYAGEKLTIYVYATYVRNSSIYPVEGVPINFTFIVNSRVIAFYDNELLNIYGYISFNIILPVSTKVISLDVVSARTYKYKSANITNHGIDVINLNEIINRIIFFMILIISFMIIVILSYFKLVYAKKHQKLRILNEFKQVFEDILKIQYIIIIHKKTEIVIFQKSYFSEEIDKDMITFIKSTNNFSENASISQISVKESDKNKFLLLNDGKKIKIYVLLSREVSSNFIDNTKDFLNYFEKSYKNIIENPHDHLKFFSKIEQVLETKLNISLIQPHKLEYKLSKDLLTLDSKTRDLFNLADSLVKESGQNFFYIYNLLNKFSSQIKQSLSNFFFSLKELTDNKFIIPTKKNF